MSSDRFPISLLLACVLSLLGGCISVPPAPANAQKAASSDDDPYEGWLFRSLTGQSMTTEAASPSVVAPNPPPGASGPMIPGPASPSSSRAAAPSGPVLIPSASKEPIAGPPPSIPDELPAAPSVAVSITDARETAEEQASFDISDLAPENIYGNIKQATGYGPDEKIARAVMQEGQALFRDKKYKEAAGKFAAAGKRWPDSPLEEDALFLKGESEFFFDQYPKAHDTFGGLLKKYSNTRHLDTVVEREFAMGRYWEQLYEAHPIWPIVPNVTDGSRPRFDSFGYAIQAYQRVRMYDPTGPLADDSLMASASAYFRHGQFENAAYDYDLLRKEYANSEHQANAHVLGLQAKMRIYQGSTYISAPLEDAGRIADQTLAQFGDKLGDEREHVAKARAQIIEEKANREFTVARYYENRKCYGAARLYYQSVIKEYPGTDKANQAQARLEKIRNEPDSPPNHFEWLTKPFESL